MRRFIRRFSAWSVFVVLMVVAPVVVFAQAGQGGAQGSAEQATGEGGAQYRLKLPVPLVIEDVVVLDNKEQPVHGLHASDFLVTENGKAVTLRSFEEHEPTTAPASAVQQPPLGANIFTNIPDVPPSTSLNILLLDALNTPTGAQAIVRQQLLQFLKELAPGSRVAIFGLGTQLVMLQGFTDNPAILRAAVESKVPGPLTSPLLELRQSQDEANPLFDSFLDSMMREHPDVGQGTISALQKLQAQQSAVAVRLRMVYTLQAMNAMARYLSVLPGHKNLIWFSGSFPLNIMPNDQLADPFEYVNDFRDDVRQTADLMARGRIAVYPVDARGLMMNSGFNSAEYGVNHFAETHSASAADAAARHLAADQTYSEYDTMDQMAAFTGGKAFYDTNGLKGAVEKIFRYGESYYTIAYSPADLNFDGKYRKIAIKSGDLNVHLSFRVGYFADDPNARPTGKKTLPLSAMQTAMMHGVPNAIQVGFDVAILPGEKPVDELTPGAHADTKHMTPPYMSYTVQYILNVRSVQFTVDAEKVHHGLVELASYIYDHEGNVINTIFTKVNLDLPDDRFKQVTEQGLLTRQTIDAPVKGENFLRVGIRDLSNDHIGALEIPIGKLKSLAELKKAGNRE